jgi:hypothetical protein
MENKLRNYIRKIIAEQFNPNNFLGYHSSKKNLKDGLYQGASLSPRTYADVIRNAYMDIISDSDENMENNDISAMSDLFDEKGYGFTFVSTQPIEASAFQSDKYKYGNYLYEVYGDGNEILLDDPNELNATIIVSKTPLYLKKISIDQY